MRLLAEEKKSGTDELLFTSPLSVGQIVLGKYLAALIMLAVMLGLTAVSVVFAFAYGNPGARALAHRLPRAVPLGRGVHGRRPLLLGPDGEPDRRRHPDLHDASLLFYVLNWVASIGSGAWQGVLGYLSFSQHFEDMARGILDTKDLVYFLSFSFFGLFLAHSVHPVPAVEVSHGHAEEEPQPRRRRPHPRGPRGRDRLALPQDRHPRPRRRWASRPWPPTSLLNLAALKQGVHAQVVPLLGQHAPRRRPRPGHPGPGQLLPVPKHTTGWTSPRPSSTACPTSRSPSSRASRPTSRSRASSARATTAGRPWRTCSSSTPTTPARVKYEFIDPDKNPGLVKRYDVTQDGTTVIEAGDKEGRITTTSEEDLTNALIKATRAQKKVIYFLEGHGEESVDETGDNGYSTAKAELEKLGYEVKKQTLALADRFPKDCALLVVPGPQKDLLPNEYETIRAYIKDGGRALFLVDPGDADPPAALPRRLRLQARERHRRRHRLPAPRRRLLHARRQRVRVPRHHRQVRLRDVLPLRPLGRGRRDQARGGDGRRPWPRRAPTPGPSASSTRRRSSSRRTRTSRGRSAWRPSSSFKTKPASPAPAEPSPASRPRRAARPSRSRPRRRPGSPSSATPISSRTAITACPATAISSSTSPTG